MARNSITFDAAIIATKPAWLQRQLAGLIAAPQSPPEPPAHVPAAPKPVKARKRVRKARIARVRNAGTITEAAYWGMVRSGLRRLFRFWKPAVMALNASRVPVKGPRGQKWAYLCADCGKLFLRKAIQIDHVVPVGTLLAYEHVGEFLKRLTPEDPSAYAVRCLSCHQEKTNKEKAAAK